MRHRKAGVKLNRTSSHRKAMFRNMVTSLLKYERIQTTDAKAKELRRWADHIITLAKRGDLHARRQVLSIVREKDVVYKLFAEANERFGATEGGYTRVVKIGRRRGDAAPVSIIELVGPAEGKPRRKRKKKKKETAETAAPTPQTADTADTSADQTEGAEKAAGAQEARETTVADVPGQETPAGEAAVDEEALPETDAPATQEPLEDTASDVAAEEPPAGEEKPSGKKD